MGGAASGCWNRAETNAELEEGLAGVASGDLNGLGRVCSMIWDFVLSMTGETNADGLVVDEIWEPEARAKLFDIREADANPEA